MAEVSNNGFVFIAEKANKKLYKRQAKVLNQLGIAVQELAITIAKIAECSNSSGKIGHTNISNVSVNMKGE